MIYDRDTEWAPSTRRRVFQSGPPLSPGDVLGEKYRIQRTLGEGAMGTVYLANHLDLNREVAIKVLKSDVQANEEYNRRFQREARATSQLDHPFVVRVLDFGHRPLLFIVMEYIQGKTLGQFLKTLTEPPPVTFVLRVTEQVLSALQAAHERGIIHRDLKPDNVLLTGSGDETNVKVVDFGLAHFEDDADAGPTLTRHDIIAGTPAYMSPEQCQSMAVTAASDLYSIGCILTELLQLSPPYDGESAAVLMAQQMFSPPPPLIRPVGAEAVPTWLDDLRLELLAKHRHRRPASAKEVRQRIVDGGAGKPAERGTTRGSLTPPAPEAETSGELSRVSIRLGEGSSVNAATRAGLAMHGIDVVAEDAPVVLLRGDAELAQLASEVAALVDAGTSVLVYLDKPRAKELPSLIEAGVSDVLPKPLEPTRLARAVRRVYAKLDRRTARFESRQ